MPIPTARRSSPRSRRSRSKWSPGTSRRRGASRSCRTAACSSPSAPASCDHLPKDKSGAVVTVTGTPKRVGAPGRRAVRRRSASAIREERLDLPVVLRAGPELHAAASAAEGAAPPPPKAAGGRGPADAEHPVDDHDRPREDRQEQRVDRSAGDLPRAADLFTTETTRTTARASSSTGRDTSSTPSASAA